MLTNFFGKSKPINFIIVSIYLISWIFFKLIFETEKQNNEPLITNFLLTALGVLFLLFLLNFIIRKNRLTKVNTYSVLFFSSFMALIPTIFTEWDLLLANLFLLLALRRIWSMPSEKNLKKKVLDASIWISVAALFYFWSILLFIVLFISILQRGSKNLKLLWIPLVGCLAVFTLVTAYYLWTNDSLLWFLSLESTISLDFSVYKQPTLFSAILFFSIIMIWSLIQRAFSISKGSIKDKANFKILFVVLLSFIMMVLLDPTKNGGELLLIMATLAILTTNFIENHHTFWLKELFLWTAVILPFFIVIL